MNRLKSQSGSVHVIIAIILVIALIGVLDYIAWQKFFQQGSTTKKATTSNSQSSKTTTTKTLSFNPSAKTPITFTHPQNWTVERTTTKDADNIKTTSGSDDAKIYSPSKKIYVELSYQILSGGFGFECGEAEILKYMSLVQTKLSSYSDMSYFQAVVNSDNDGFFYSAYIGKTASADELKTTQSQGYCYFSGANLIERVEPDDEGLGGVYAVWHASIKATDFIDNNGGDKLVTGTSALDDLFASDEFKAAKNILLSAKHTD